MNLVPMLNVSFFLLEKRRRIILLARRVNAYDFLLLVIDRTYNMCLSSFALWMREKHVLICILFCFMDARKKCVLQVEIFLRPVSVGVHVTVSKMIHY